MSSAWRCSRTSFFAHLTAVKLLALASALVSCLPEVDPNWLITGPRFLLIEQTVIATGPLAAPLWRDPPGSQRVEALPGDRLRLEVVIVGPEGRIEPAEPPLWLRRTRFSFNDPRLVDQIPPCADDGRDGLSLCRLADGVMVVPEIPTADVAARSPSQFLDVTAVVSLDGGPGAATCFELIYDLQRPPIPEECRIGGHYIRLGPSHVVVALSELEVEHEVLMSDADFRVREVELVLTITGPQGVREVIAGDGEVVVVDPAETIALEVRAGDEEDLQEWTGAREALIAEWLRARIWATAPVLPEGVDRDVGSLFFRIRGPEAGGSYHLFLAVTERGSWWEGYFMAIEVVSPGGTSG